MSSVHGQPDLMMTVWGQEQAEARAWRDVPGSPCPGGAGADVLTWMLLGLHSV